uniref:BHLH domain-containing protein n=1 Tax=Aegilops tauschii TaxID=37682 RepID=M8CEB8_AEGTA
MAQQRRLGSLWSFLRQQDVGESIAAGNGSSDLLRIFSMSTCDDTNSNIIFSAPGSKKAEVLGDSDVGMVTSFSNIDSQERRTRINKRLRRLQDLIPYMDKVTRSMLLGLMQIGYSRHWHENGYSVPQALQNNAQSNFSSGHDSLKLLSSILKKRLTRINGHALRKIAKEYEIFLE